MKKFNKAGTQLTELAIMTGLGLVVTLLVISLFFRSFSGIFTSQDGFKRIFERTNNAEQSMLNDNPNLRTVTNVQSIRTASSEAITSLRESLKYSNGNSWLDSVSYNKLTGKGGGIQYSNNNISLFGNDFYTINTDIKTKLENSDNSLRDSLLSSTNVPKNSTFTGMNQLSFIIYMLKNSTTYYQMFANEIFGDNSLKNPTQNTYSSWKNALENQSYPKNSELEFLRIWILGLIQLVTL